MKQKILLDFKDVAYQGFSYYLALSSDKIKDTLVHFLIDKED